MTTSQQIRLSSASESVTELWATYALLAKRFDVVVERLGADERSVGAREKLVADLWEGRPSEVDALVTTADSGEGPPRSLDDILARVRGVYEANRDELNRAKRTAKDWRKTATIAVRAGDDELAKEALARRAELRATVLAFENELHTLELLVSWLESHV